MLSKNTSRVTLAAVAVAAVTSLAAAAPSTNSTDHSKPSFLFVQTSEGAEYKDGKLTLIKPSTVFFSDRPERIAGQMPSSTYVMEWSQHQDSLKKDPPNAVLSMMGEQGRPQQVLLILRSPHIEGENLSYDVTVPGGKLPAKTQESALFIDNMGWGCPGGEYVGAPCWADRAFNKGNLND